MGTHSNIPATSGLGGGAILSENNISGLIKGQHFEYMGVQDTQLKYIKDKYFANDFVQNTSAKV